MLDDEDIEDEEVEDMQLIQDILSRGPSRRDLELIEDSMDEEEEEDLVDIESS